MTSKVRAKLRGEANKIETILYVGKGGVTENLVKEAECAVKARELVKGKVLENSLLTPREVAEELGKAVRGEVIQVIGTKFVLYRKNKDKKK